MKKALVIVSFLGFLAACTYEKGEVPEIMVAEDPCDSTISYADDVVPIVSTHCVGCHDGFTVSSDFSSYANLKIVADNGALKQKVYTTHDMPQGGTMPDGDRIILKCWAQQGAPNN